MSLQPIAFPGGLWDADSPQYMEQPMLSIKRRIQIEDEVILEAIKRAKAAGFTLHSTSDGEERHKTTEPEQCLEVARSVDEGWIYFTKVKPDGKRVMVSIYFVRGNDGPDVICDYSLYLGFDEAMDATFEWARKYDKEVYGV